MDKDIEYVKRAVELSKLGTFPYGAVVVKDDKIIGEAMSGDGESYDPTNHAETLAIRRACKNLNTSDLTGATIYSSCEPCFLCFGTIWWANISNIVYGVSIKDSKSGLDEEIKITVEELNNKTGNKINIKGNVLVDEAVKVMENWKQKT
jgi:tRNA(Arg) A34 adenosine deaminase TadA